jgi:hypothetical protein
MSPGEHDRGGEQDRAGPDPVGDRPHQLAAGEEAEQEVGRPLERGQQAHRDRPHVQHEHRRERQRQQRELGAHEGHALAGQQADVVPLAPDRLGPFRHTHPGAAG